MKTQNKIQKTENSTMTGMILRGAAVVCSIVLLSWTVTAQDFWKTLLTANSFGEIGMMMATQSSEFEKADAVAEAVVAELDNRNAAATEALKTEADNSLRIEDWMTNEALFNAKPVAVDDEADEPLTLESWMINKVATANLESAPVENDPALQLEPWMTNNENFASAGTLTEKDDALQLESWMSNDSLFEKATGEPLRLEAWMSDSEVWGF